MPEHSSRSASIAVTERSDRSLREGCQYNKCFACHLSSMPVVLSTNNNDSSVLPPVVYNFSNCTVHHTCWIIYAEF